MPAAPLVSLGSNNNVPGLQSAHEPETEEPQPEESEIQEPQTEEPETQESGTHENTNHHHLLTPSAIGIGTGLYCAILPFGEGKPAMVATVVFCVACIGQNYSRQIRQTSEGFPIETQSDKSHVNALFDWLLISSTTVLVIGFLNS